MSNNIPINILVGLIGTNDVNSGLASIRHGISGVNDEAMRAPAGAAALGKLTSIAGAVVTALATVKEALDIGNELTSLSDQVEASQLRARLGAEAYQVLGFHLRQAGGDAAELVGALEFMRRTLGEASDATSQQAKDLAELHLSYRSLATLPTEAKFERIARALMQVSDENRRAALTASLLGRSSAGLNDLIEALASRGYANLATEARKAAGILSNETTTAIDEAGDRASAANEKFSKLFAPVVVSAQRGKAALAEFKVSAGEAAVDVGANAGSIAKATIGMTAAILAAGPAIAAAKAVFASGGSIGMKLAVGAAEGEIAAAGLATSFAASLKAALASTWVVGGALIAAAVLAGLAVNRLGNAAVEARAAQTAGENADDTMRGNFAAQLAGARDQATVDRVSALATKNARYYSAAAAGETDETERARLETLAKQYSLIVAQAREKGGDIIAANRALDAQNKIKDAAAAQLDKAKQTSAELAKQVKAYQEAADKARYSAAKDEEKLALLDRQILKGYQQYQIDLKAAELAGDETAKVAALAKWDAVRLDVANERAATEKRILDGKKRQAELEQEAAKAAEQAHLEEQRKSAGIARDKMEDRQNAAQAKLTGLDTDFRRTDAEKWAERRAALQESAAAAQEYLQKMKDLRALATTPEAQAQGDANVRAAGKDAATADRELAMLGPDPNSFSEQAIAGITRLREEWTLTAKSMAESMVSALSTAQGATSNFLFDGLSGAKSWSDAWDAATLQVGQQFLRMITDQISKLLWKSTVERAMIALGVGKHTAGEAMKTTATATGTAARLGMIVKEALASVYKGAVQAFEALSSIPYVGPILGAAAMAAAVAGGIALVSKIAGHADGGFHNGPGWVSGPGTATSDSINARLSNGEWVAPVWQTKHPVWGPIIRTLEAGRRGEMPGFASGGLFGGYGMPADGSAAFLSASTAVAASANSGSFGQDDIGFMRRESGRNIHVYLDRSVWLDAVRNDLTGLAHEVYEKKERS